MAEVNANQRVARAGEEAPGVQAPASPEPGAALSSNATYNRARTASQVFDAKLKELDYQRAKGELIRVDDAKRIAFTAFRTLRDAILNVPARVKDACAAETDAFKVEQILDAELGNTLASFDLRRVLQESEDDDET
jgi:hypothetical protein